MVGDRSIAPRRRCTDLPQTTTTPTGAILTKLDGDTRGGAALSVRGVSGKPIKVRCPCMIGACLYSTHTLVFINKGWLL